MNPCHFVLLCLAGWVNREQQSVIQYLQEERNHQGLDSRIIAPEFEIGAGEIHRQKESEECSNFIAERQRNCLTS
jgi:hypothetical protein